ncbi:MAG: O-antigen ligase family protein [Chthoniobacter sp.]|uniref:O-antigen ligase family protein n=1 Tax=Chthoniobacter sp. TaxID=2510640 RepID=UPI0032AAE142
MSRRGSRRAQPEQPEQPAPTKKPLRLTREMVALGIFAIIVIVGPLLFGMVDRLPQIGLLVLLGIGILVQPPAIVPLSRWGNRLALAFIGLLLFKEFAPASWFGDTFWRTTLTRQYALQLPFTHHPEPSRALDALLAGAVGVVWFLWVRRLAVNRQHRAFLAWALFVAAAIVAVVSFATKHPGSDAIYEGTVLARWTPGWGGFGPFPNRNHTADYFAMAGVLGCGCVAWAAARKNWTIFCSGLVLVGLIVVALLTTQSRGGLIAFGAGVGIYLLLCLAKMRNRRALGAALGTALFFGALMLTFGSQVFARFHSHEGGAVSNLTRIAVWHDAIAMWRDAPLLGHGLDSFAGVFPLYQKIQLENQIVLHPESNWLQWLAELGLIPVLLAAAALALFLGRHGREIFGRQRSFFLHAGGFAAFAVILVHAIFDVPAHRWGTAGFALAALALACPMRIESRRVPEPRQAALVPLAIAGFWWLPLHWFVPAWSPLCLNRLIELDALAPGLVQLAELETALRYFPLNADLHQSVGLRDLKLFGRDNPAAWQRHFGIATRLQPGVWETPMAQARACQRVAPVQALAYWQLAVERGDIHRDEILRTAVTETGRFPAAQSSWGHYVEAHPQLLLAYAQIVPEQLGAYYYGRWWKLRSNAPDLSAAELRSFYQLAPRWGNKEDFDDWAKHHVAEGVRDNRQWAALWHHWGEDDRAWHLLSIKVVEPSFPAVPSTVPRAVLETTWRTHPENVVNAQQLALLRQRDGDQADSDEIIIAVAHGENPPPWFVEKAAWILARAGRTGEAVDVLLRPR